MKICLILKGIRKNIKEVNFFHEILRYKKSGKLAHQKI